MGLEAAAFLSYWGGGWRWGDLGLHVSSAGVEKPETFGFKVRVSGGSSPPVGC